MIEQTISLNLVPGSFPPVVHVNQYDTGARTIKAYIYNGSTGADLEDVTSATVCGTKPSKTGFSYDDICTIDADYGTISFDITEQMTVVAGPVRCGLILNTAEGHLGTLVFILDVQEAALTADTIIDSDDFQSIITDAVIAYLEESGIADVASRAYDMAFQAYTVSQEANSRSNIALTNSNTAKADADEALDSVSTFAAAYSRVLDIINAGIVTDTRVSDGNLVVTYEDGTTATYPIEGGGGGGLGFTDWGYEDGFLHLYDEDGEDVLEPLYIGAGGGGGGGNNAILTVTNTTGWLTRTIAEGASCPVSLSWSSLEDQIPTGNGTLRITVGGVTKAVMDVAQGTVTEDLGGYLAAGVNTVKVTISDVYDNSRTITFTITSVSLSISSSFDAATPYTGAVSFPYTPYGETQKTVYFILDGSQLGTVTTSVSGRQLSYAIPAQSHGGHTLEVWFTSTINGETVSSNHLYYEFISLEDGETDPIIVSSFHETTAAQYATLNIPYIVYDPSSLTAAVTVTVNGTQAASLTVDRTEQTFTYRPDAAGALTVVFASGTALKTITLTVTESDIDVEAETENLALYLASAGRSNSEANPGTWTYGNISATFTDFNFVSDGWINDADGVTALRVSGDARLTIPYQIFATDFRGTGKTIEVEFATRDVLDYDAVILSCLSGGRGLSVTAQRATLTSEQSEISMQYKEDEHVRLSFAVEKRSENRLVYVYVNGIMSGVVQYPVSDDFSQASPVGISIGSNDCTTDIYCVRVYDNDLTRYQILDNWIADTQNGALMLDRYARNSVYDAYGDIVISKLPASLPYMVIECAELPQYKGDKKTVSVTYVDPATPENSFTASNVQADVQGTSSQYYARKNYKLKYKGGFDMTQGGTHAATYAMRAGAIQTDTFTMKADVASSEGANNVELARLYNDACPYETPPQVENSAVRQGIDGFPCVVFWNDGAATTFLGKYNFNNDKGTPEVFGFSEGDESWEIKNNTSSRVLWKSADYTGDDWLNDFEARYPDTDPPYTDPAQLSAFAAWLVSTDQTAATGDPLDGSYTDVDGTVHTVDDAAYRLAKFKTEAADYMEMDSAIFYYLFTELFLMVDSRAKNAFPSFMGSDVYEHIGDFNE